MPRAGRRLAAMAALAAVAGLLLVVLATAPFAVRAAESESESQGESASASASASSLRASVAARLRSGAQAAAVAEAVNAIAAASGQELKGACLEYPPDGQVPLGGPCYPGTPPQGACPCKTGLVCPATGPSAGTCVSNGTVVPASGCQTDPDSCSAMYTCQVLGGNQSNVCLPYPRKANMACNASPDNCMPPLHCKGGKCKRGN